MALNNIIPPSKQITTAAGKPLAGGKVFLFEPGTTTFVNSYQDSGLVTPHTNPVKLSGSGRANIWITRDVDMYIADRNSGDLIPTNIILSELNANPDALGADESGGLIPNGSFELDADADTIPDGWDLLSESGSTNAIDNSDSTDGAQSFRFTSSGAGGGSLTTSDFFPVNDVDPLRVNVDLRSSVAGVHNIVRVEWYDVSQVAISNSDPYDSTSNPLTWTSQNLVALPPAGARFAKLKLIGCDPDTAVAGSTWFDRASVFYPAVVTGVFDNITIQNNEIITTNTNGNLNITPNGTGRVRMKNNTVFVDAADTQVGLVGFDASAVNMELANDVDGGLVSLIADDTGAVTRNLLVADPDAGVSVYYQGGKRVESIADGLRLFKSDSLDTGNNAIRLVHANGTERGYVGHLNASLVFVNEINSGQVSLLANDAGGVQRFTFAGNPDAGATLYYIGDTRLVTTNTGINIRGALANDPTAGGAQDAQIVYLNNSGAQAGLVGFASGNANLSVLNRTYGGNVLLQAFNVGGTQRNLFNADPDGVANIYHAGEQRISTGNTDVSIYKSNSTDVGNNLYSLRHANGTQRGFMGHIDTNMDFRNQINGGLINIRGTDSGGTLRNGVIVNPSSNVNLYYNGTLAAQTLDPSNGGLQVNNTLTGGGIERVLTTSDAGAVSPTQAIKSTNTTRASTTTQTADPELSVSIATSGLYKVDLWILTQAGSATPNIKLGLDWSGGVNDNRGYLAWGTDATGTENIFDGQFSSTPAALAFQSKFSTIGANLIRISGMFDANGAGTLALHWSQNTSDANATTVLRHSVMEITQLSAI